MRRWTAYLAAMLCALLAAPALAAASGPSLRCAAASAPDEPLAALAADSARWRCGPAAATLHPTRTVLRLSVAPGSNPTEFETRASLFGGLTLALVRDGRIVSERYHSPGSLMAGKAGSTLRVALPGDARQADAVLAAFDLPTTRGLFSDAALKAPDPREDSANLRMLLLCAMICGMLMMPLAFNAAYYRVLRERFVLWHLAVTSALLVQCLLNSGILSHFLAIPVPIYAAVGTLSFGAGVAAAAGFSAAFIEPNRLDPRLRRGLYVVAAQILVVTVLHILFPQVARPIQTPVFYVTFIPALVLFCAVMVDAWRRGSRAVRYQLVAWSPFLAVGVVRIVTMLVPWLENSNAMPLFYLAMVVQSIATSLGVADRFMIIKRQRDRALVRATSLEALSERDDLTGLYNRRALDGRLGDFARQKFTGFALFDLDHFKRVNDTRGHAVGDAVLRTVASVLDGHEESVALRMGGEEFLLLLHGDQVQERVERLREAIPVRIAREVAELEVLVTASAGLVEAAPGRDIGSDFVALYRAADDLLYEAKHNGRNLLAAVTLSADAGEGGETRVAAV